MKPRLIRALVVIGSAVAALLISAAPAQAMSIHCFKTATVRHFDTLCVVIHDDGHKEYFVVRP